MGFKYDEEREVPQPLAWVIITLFSFSIMGFGLLVYRIVEDGPRYWDVGQLPDTPAESVYSTEEPWSSTGPERQMLQLPEAKPKLPPKPHNVQLRERVLK